MQKTAKKVCFSLLAFVLILSLLPVSAFAAASDTTQWVGTDLQLGEDLTMRFYANISNEHAADGVMTVTVDGAAYKSYTVSEMTAGANGYVFEVALGAPQMTSQVKLTLVSGGETVLERTSSIRDYADAILNGKYTGELKSLVKWMLNYGAAAQGYFLVNTANPANAGYELESNLMIAEEAPGVDVSGSLQGVKYYGASMVLRSKIALRFYFAVSGSESYTYTCNGEDCEAELKDGLFYVEVPDMNPQAMNDKVQVVVSDGTDSITVSYSPMDYITRMYRKASSSDALKTMLSYAVDYFDAAQSYVTGDETLEISESYEVGAYGAEENFTIDLSGYTAPLNGYALTGATVNGTAFTSASYADGKVSLDRATVQALSGQQTVELTFTYGSRTLHTAVDIDVYTMLIASAADLAVFPTAMAAKPAGSYALVSDIDMNGVAFENTNTTAFTGTFDGRGHAIYNMATKTSYSDWDGGFFGKMFKGTLKNVAFANATVKGQGAFLAFRNNAGTMENVYLRVCLDSPVSDMGWINDTSVLFNDGEGNYLYATNVIVEYEEPLKDASSGYPFYQNLSVSKFNGLYAIGADKISTGTLPGSSTAYGVYAKRAAFDVDVAAWEGDFWTVKNGFPIPKCLIGTAYENGPIYADELTVTDTYYVGAQNSGDIVLDLSDYDLTGTVTSVTVGGTAVTGSLADGILTLSRSGLSFTEGETVAVTVQLQGEGSKLSVDLTLTVCTYTMGTAAELAAFPSVMANNLTGTFVLVSDIDMAGTSFVNTCGDGKEFAGTFDGQGYVIYNFCSKNGTADWAGGLFGKHFRGTLKNIAFVNATVKGQGSFLACKGNGGTMENIYFLAKVEDLVSSYTSNGWVNNTSIFFNTTPASAITVKNVVLEYTQPLTNNNGWGYAFGLSNGGTVAPDGFYIIGADKPANSGANATALYEYRASFDADVSAWDETDFWAVVDGFPIPERLVGVKIPFAISSDAVGYIGEKNTGDTFILNLSDVRSQLAGTSLVDATVDGVSFAVKSYQGGIVTLDKATAGTLSGEKDIVLIFENEGMRISVSAKIAAATYVISTPAEMANFPTVMAENLAGTYVLVNDIDMAGVSYSNGNTAANFTGTFDGQGHVIYNMCTKTDATDWDGGFFGKLYAGTMRNVAFANATVKGQAAFLAFRSIGGKLENVYISFAFDSMVSGTGNFTQDTSVLFNDGNGNYLDATNVVIEYAEPLTNASAGYAVYQSFSQSKINGLYVIGADKVIQNSFSGSNGIFGCYNDRAAFDADVSAWDETDFWAVVDGFPIPERLVGTIYENGYVVENELDLTASVYVDGTKTSVTATFGNVSKLAGKTFGSATLGGEKVDASYNEETGAVTLNVADIGALTETQQVKVAFLGDDGIYVAYVTLIPADKVFYTAEDLAAFPTLMTANPAGTYALGADIDFAGYTYENTMTAAFTGTFDGNGYCISNMATKTSYTDWDGGLFGKDFRGTLKNIAFNDAVVKGQGAFLAFRNHGGTMTNVYLKVSFDEPVSGNSWINDTTVLFNDSEGSYLYATNVIVEYAETPAAGGNPFYYNTSVSKFNGLYAIGANAISNQALPGSSGTDGIYGVYADRAALSAAVDFSGWYTDGFWVADASNTPIPKGLYTQPHTGPIHEVSVVTNTTRKLIQGGQSDYKIIVDQTNTADKKAADIMIKYLARSGVTLPIVTADQYTADGKFIVINNDSLFASAGLTLDNRLDVAGYMIQTVGDNVFLQSAGTEGIQYAAAAFLKHTLGLEVYGTPDSITVTAGSWAWMPDFDITDQPDIETHIMGNWRDSANADVQYLMGYTDYADYFLMAEDTDGNGVYNHGTENHTSMMYLPRSEYYSSHWKWYSGKSQFNQWFDAPDQLCYTAHGDAAELEAMVQEAAQQMMVRIKAQPNAIAGQFSVSDTHTACECSTCTASKNQYGTDAAAVIQFTNKLNAALRELMAADPETAGREFTLYLMAYHEYAIAPVVNNVDGSYAPIDQTVVCDDGVGVLYAPIEAMYTTDLYDDVNAEIAENMEKWATLSDSMYYWLYDTNFENYFVPYGSWKASTENMEHSYNNNASIVFVQGQYNTQASTGFTTLKVYLNAAFAWNVNSDYDALVDKFFSTYYGAAGEPMRTLYDDLQAWLVQLETNYPTVFTGWHSVEGQEAATYWTYEKLTYWLGLIEEAKTLAADSTTALNHITNESMFIRYLLITNYPDQFTAEELAAMKSAFNADAKANGFTQLASQTAWVDLT